MWKKSHVLISLLFLIFAGNLPTAQAQEIKIDGNTASIVTRDGNQITIAKPLELFILVLMEILTPLKLMTVFYNCMILV